MANIAGPSKILFGEQVDGASLSLLSEVYEPSSTLQYVNSQLVAHGFASSPGLSLDGLAIDDSQRVVKCLLAMLSQRLDDLGRTEELGSKLRTLSYEHERLQSLHRTAVDNGANAEREMNLFKSKLAASQRELSLETTAHKQTTSELQKTRTSLQYLRSTAQNELKRKDKEVERVLERWNKVCDTQAKLSGAQNGLKCANYAVGIEEYVKGKGLTEEALEQAEQARKELLKENEGFRSVILCTANALQDMIYNVSGLEADSHVEEPIPLSHAAVFAPPTSSLPDSENAYIKVRELVSTCRDVISNISKPGASSSAQASENEEEITKLNDVINALRNELNQSRQSSNALAVQAQDVLERFTIYASERFATGRDPTPEEAAEMSMELIGVLEHDELREKLDKRAKMLEAERQKFTEATVKLGKEKTALEAERLRLLEEKRRWAVEQMLAELPATPGPDPDLVCPRPSESNQPKSPPRVRSRNIGGSRGALKSPVKKASPIRRTQGYDPIEQKPDISPKKKLGMRKKGVMFETVEVLYEAHWAADSGLKRSTSPEDSPVAALPPTLPAEMKNSPQLVLPTTFKLPPPSPASSLAVSDLKPILSSTSEVSPSTVPSFDAIPLATSSRPALTPSPRQRMFPSPRTPRPPANSHLKHAYSPARPSPLSRILMTADSPASMNFVPPILEEDEENESDGDSVIMPPQNTEDLLDKGDVGQELQLEMLMDEPSPLRELKGSLNNPNSDCGTAGERNGLSRTSGKGTSPGDGGGKLTTAEKGKGRAVSPIQGITATEKENLVAVTQASRSGKIRSGVTSNAKPPTRHIGSGMRSTTVGGRADVKPPPAASRAVSKAVARGGPPPVSRPQGGVSQSGAGTVNVNTVRPTGGLRSVPVGNTNAAKSGAKRV